MTLYAVERIDDAVSLTRSLLLPVRWRLWAKLALVGAFVAAGSGGGGATTSLGNLPSSAGNLGEFPGFNLDLGGLTIPEGSLVAAGVLISLVLLVGLAVAAAGAVMEFVLVEALASGEVRLRAWSRRYARRGFRLFAFRLVLGTVATATVATATVVGVALAAFWPEVSTFLSGEPITTDGVSLVIRGLLVGFVVFVVGVVTALVHGVTTEFVVPVVLRHGGGILAGWRRFWPTLRGNLRQYVAYLAIGFALRVATSIGAGIVVSILSAVVLVPFAAVGLALGVGTLVSGTVSLVLLALLVTLVLGYLVVLVLVSATVYVPVRAFHRYFALLVLGDTDGDLDVLGDRRPALGDAYGSA